jgi:hypothetical protein
MTDLSNFSASRKDRSHFVPTALGNPRERIAGTTSEARSAGRSPEDKSRAVRPLRSSGGQRSWPNFCRTVVVMLVAMAVSGTARADEAGVSDEARDHFRSGVALLQDPDGARYEEAYREFKTAYGMSPSAKILGNLGYTALKLERDKEAIDAYERYLREAPDIQPDERKQVEGDLQTLKTGMVRVTLNIEIPGGIITDRRLPARGEPIVNAYGVSAGRLELGLRSGRHVIEVRFNQGEPLIWQFDAMPGGKLSHDFARPVATEAPAPQRSSRTVPIVLTVAGGVLLAAGAVTGFVALDRAKRIDQACPNDTCPNGYGIEGERSTAYTLVRTTDVLLIGGGVLAVTGLGWLIFARKPSPATPAASAGCTGNGCGAFVAGRF